MEDQKALIKWAVGYAIRRVVLTAFLLWVAYTFLDGLVMAYQNEIRQFFRSDPFSSISAKSLSALG